MRWGRASQRPLARTQPRHRMEQRATALRSQDWSAHELPVLVTAGKLQECLRQGLPVPGSVCEFWSFEALEHIQELWGSFGCNAPLTALLTGGCDPYQTGSPHQSFCHQG